MEQDLIIFDLETTDINELLPGEALPEIVEIGALFVDRDFKIKEKFHTYVRPLHLDRYTNHCFQLTKIPRETLERAQPFMEVWEEFSKFTKYNHKRMGGWKVGFDEYTLRLAYSVNKLGWPHCQFMVDIASWWWGFCTDWGIRLRGGGLDEACEVLGIEIQDRHNAIADCLLTLEVLKEVESFEDNLTK